jgi:pimeloyl-ACP methyl ester carboxylesterase
MESDAEVQERAHELLRLITAPARRNAPRVARQLEDARQVRVDTPYGWVPAWRLGEGPATLLVHGWEDDHCLWSRMIDALRARSVPVVVFDLPGHGGAQGKRCYSFEAADAVLAVASVLGPISAVIAHSFAAGPVIVALAEGLPAERTALISSPFSREDRWVRVGAELGFSEQVAHRAAAIYRSQFSPSRSAVDWFELTPKLDTDLLFVHSVDDERARVEPVREVAGTCPRGRLVELTGLDHRATARDPRAIEVVLSHLEQRREEAPCVTSSGARP